MYWLQIYFVKKKERNPSKEKSLSFVLAVYGQSQCKIRDLGYNLKFRFVISHFILQNDSKRPY